MKIKLKDIKKIDKISQELMEYTKNEKFIEDIINNSSELNELLNTMFSVYENKALTSEEYQEICNLNCSNTSKQIMKKYIAMEQFAILEETEIEDINEIIYNIDSDAPMVDTVKQYLISIGNIPLYTVEEEREIFERYKENPTIELRNEIAEHNLRLVVSIAKKYHRVDNQFMDSVADGNIGLLRAVERFDVTKGYKFSTFATWWIRQAITRQIADTERIIRIPVHLLERINKVKIARLKYEQVHFGQTPTKQELMDITGLSRHELDICLKNERDVESLDVPVGEVEHGEQSVLGDFISDNSVSVEKEGERNILREIMKEYLDGLTDRERSIIELRFGLNDEKARTLEEVGKEYNVTRERIRQIEAKALRKLRNPRRTKMIKDFIDNIE